MDIVEGIKSFSLFATYSIETYNRYITVSKTMIEHDDIDPLFMM